MLLSQRAGLCTHGGGAATVALDKVKNPLASRPKFIAATSPLLLCVCVCVCVCGCGCVCMLCAGNLEDKTVPTLVQALNGHKIVGVSCGSGDAHTIALEDNGTQHGS